MYVMPETEMPGGHKDDSSEPLLCVDLAVRELADDGVQFGADLVEQVVFH